MKKLVSLLLVLAMLLTLAACGQTETAPTDGAVSTNGAAAPATSDTQELVTLKILCKNDRDANVKLEDWEDYVVSDMLKEKLAEMGIAIELETISNGDFANVVRTRMASGVDMPDIIAVAFDSIGASEIAEWGMNGLIIPASDLMESYDTDGSITAYWDKHAPNDRFVQTAPDGKLYWFTYLYNSQKIDKDTGEAVNGNSLRLPSIRKDWVEAVGEEVKNVYTPDELFDLMVKFQEKDVNGNGVKDEVIHLSINTFYDNFARAFGLNTNTLSYVDENGVAACNFYNKEALVAYLEFMNKLYENGFYDTTSFTGDSMSNELISSNRAAVTFNYADWNNYESTVNDPNAVYVPFVLDLTGSLEDGWYAQGDFASATYNQYFVTSSCKNPEAAAKLFDFIYTDEYAFISGFVPEVTGHMDEDGVVNPIDVGARPDINADPDGFWEWQHKYASLNGTGVGLYGLPHMNTLPQYVDTSLDQYEGTMREKKAALATMPFDTCDYQPKTMQAINTDEEADLNSRISEALGTYASELLTNIILGNQDISTLDESIAELEKLGLKDYIGMVQARYDRAVAAMG